MEQLLSACAQQGVFLRVENQQLCFDLAVDEFPADLKAQIIANKTALIEFLTHAQAQQQAFERPPIVPFAPRSHANSEGFSLSYAQQRVWFIEQLAPGSVQYNLPGVFEISGDFDVAIAQQTLGIIIERHHILRTVYRQVDGQPRQLVLPWQPFELNYVDLSHLAEDVRDAEVSRQITEDSLKAFDLTQDLMLRASYLRLSRQLQGDQACQANGVLLFNMHHIASDGWSLAVLLSEFGLIYGELSQGKKPNLAPLAIQYQDYALWQHQWLQGEVLGKQQDYWLAQLKDVPQLHGLELDFVRPSLKGHQGAVVGQVLEPDLCQGLAQSAQTANVTLFTLLHSAFALVLAQHSNRSDIVIGTAVANRMQAEVEPLIGLFANTLVLRVNTEYTDFSQYLAHVGEVNAQAQQYQDLPFETIAEQLSLQRSTAYSPLFQILLTLDNIEKPNFAIPGIDLKARAGGEVSTKFDLELLIEQHQDSLTLNWIYDRALFLPQRIEQLNQYLVQLLQLLTKQVQGPMADFVRLPADERHHLLVDYNATERACATDALVQQRFEAMVLAQPEAKAVCFEAKQLSYRQLNQQANRLAHLLRNNGVDKGAMVAICLPRGMDMVVAILAVLKAGAAYLPIDPQIPQNRVEYILDNSGLSTVICDHQSAKTLDFAACQVWLLDDEAHQQQLLQQGVENPVLPEEQNAEQLAYVIYTSGSTGQPKGVMVSHRAIYNRLEWMQNEYHLTQDDVVLQKTPFTFDVSVWEFLWPLSQGACLQVAIPDGHKDPNYLTDVMAQAKVTVVHFVPSMLNIFLHQGQLADSLRLMFCSGEALSVQSVKAVREMAPHVALHNLYGPTEAAIDVSYFDCQSISTQALTERGCVPIGKPVQNTQLYVLDQHRRLLPQGAVGELYIGGVQLAFGYLNQAQLTANSFVDTQLEGAKTQRLYKTGDVVKMAADGQIEFVGRSDSQVKIRGLRIELGEIQFALNQIAQLQEAIVLVELSKQGDQLLLAYALAASENHQQIHQQWRQQVAQWLPQYMIPTHLTLLNEWPLGDSGKIDRKQLPRPTIEQSDEYRQPQGQAEQLLASIWAGVLELDLELIGRDSRFFALGGHSLLIIRYKALLQSAGFELPVAKLYQNLSLSELAELMVEVKVVKAPLSTIPAHCSQIEPQMLAMVELTQSELGHICQQVPGGAANIEDIYPLSPLQKGILFHSLQAQEDDPYVIKTLFKCQSQQWAERFVAGFNFVVSRHDALRTCIVYQGLEEPVQVVCSDVEVPVRWIDESMLDDIDKIEAFLTDYRLAPDDLLVLERAPLLHLEIINYQGAAYVLVFNHHLIEDNFSTRVLQQEMAAYMTGRQSELVQCAQYREFIWTNLQTDASRAEDFFATMLSGFSEVATPVATRFDADAPARLQSPDLRVDGMLTTVQSLPETLSAQIQALAQQHQVATAAVFHLAWAVVIARMSNQTDIVFGTVLSGRMQGIEGIDAMVGLCINTLPLRIEIDQRSIEQALGQTHGYLDQIIEFEQTPLNELINFADIPTNSGLFDSILNFRLRGSEAENAALDQQMPGINLMFGVEHTNYAISASVDMAGDSAALTIETLASIDSDLVAKYFTQALHSLVTVAADADGKVNQVDVLDEQDIRWLSDTLNQNNAPDFDLNLEFVHQQVAAQALKRPQQLAVVDGKTSLSYGQFEQAANRLAHHLIALGVKPQDAVGLCLERSVGAMTAILATYKCGAVFVPLDPQYPDQRLAFMVQDAGVSVVLRQGQDKAAIDIGNAVDVDLNDKKVIAALEHYSVEAPVVAWPPIADPLAYIVYTSGSTGTPKGVMVGHQKLAVQIAAEAQLLEIQAGDSAITFASIGFDAFAELAWSSLTCGATLHLPLGVIWPLEQFVDYVDQQQINYADLPPSFLQILLEGDDDVAAFWAATSLKGVLVGGELMPQSIIDKWQQYQLFERCQLINAYGPTETVMACHLHPLQAGSDRRVIGKVFGQRRAYIVDKNQRLLPFGVPGELYIGGSWLAKGYLNNQTLTAQRFIQDPFMQSDPHARCYATGDKVCYLANGQMMFLERIDDQVKVRGFRVELSEIERCLQAIEGVCGGVIIAQPDDMGSNNLVAYVILQSDLSDSTDEIQHQLNDQLAAQLPHYMLPWAYVVLQQWPLTPNGKIDKKRLPQPNRQQQLKSYLAPSGEHGQALAAIWADLLKLQASDISANDNFFVLGGHSLLAVRLVSRVNSAFALKAYKLDLKRVFAFAQLQSLADEISTLIIRENNQQTQLALDEQASVVEGEL